MKKIFDQTVRDIKREVNKSVLKVPRIEQKVLDATSNEPWGPHGTLLAEIAQASRNYHEYQMIMVVIWKRINDTGKNWRHVYKALIVLEYLVANGSERVIDDIREHGYQISALSEFQYIDSSGRDQGNNVRKKSQSLVALVNDKERIVEVRQKAAANRDKFRNTSAGGMYRPTSYSSTGGYGDRYEDDHYEGRYGSRDEYGHGREKEYNNRDEDRYGRYGESYGHDGDRYGRESEERYSRDGYRNDDYRGRSRSVEDYGPRSRSSDRDKDRAFDDESQSSSRGGRADDQPQEGRQLEQKLSEQSPGAPPSYEEVISESRSPAYSERNGESLSAHAPGASPPAPRNSSPPPPKDASPTGADQTTSGSRPAVFPVEETGGFDEFDPRGPVSTSAAPTGSSNNEVDLLGSLADSFSPNPLAIMPVTPDTAAPSADARANFSAPAFAATPSNLGNQSFEDPFGDSPFMAIPSADTVSTQQQTSASSSAASFLPSINHLAEAPHLDSTKVDAGNRHDFANPFQGMTYALPDAQQPSAQSQLLPQELSASSSEADVLADILPSSDPSPVVTSHSIFTVPNAQHAPPVAGAYGNFNAQAGSTVPVSSIMGPGAPQFTGGNIPLQGASTSNMGLQNQVALAPQSNGGSMPLQSPFVSQNANQAPAHYNNGNFLSNTASAVPVSSQVAYQTPTPQLNNGNFAQQPAPMPPVASQLPYQTPGPAAQHSGDVLSNMFSQGSNTGIASQPAPASSTISLSVPQPSKEKFETKSTVWADTLSRGLVNLNISGPKINPLADIGVDFDALNRKEKRMEKPKPSTSTVTSTVTMGKAMGSGSGMGRAGAGALRPPTNAMMGSGIGMGNGMGMGSTPGSGFSMGAYGSVNRPMGMGMGMGMNPGMNMGQGGQMQPPTGYPLGTTMPGAYNPMMGAGGYNQQPYGSGYR